MIQESLLGFCVCDYLFVIKLYKLRTRHRNFVNPCTIANNGCHISRKHSGHSVCDGLNVSLVSRVNSIPMVIELRSVTFWEDF